MIWEHFCFVFVIDNLAKITLNISKFYRETPFKEIGLHYISSKTVISLGNYFFDFHELYNLLSILPVYDKFHFENQKHSSLYTYY